MTSGFYGDGKCPSRTLVLIIACLPTKLDDFLFYQQNRENARVACAGLFIGRCRSSRSGGKKQPFRG